VLACARDWLRLQHFTRYFSISLFVFVIFSLFLSSRRAKLDRHAGFWLRTQHSIQANAISTLGRIYDSNPDAHRASKLIDHR
jgi:hypothetical protein